jgi:hypothetical protein
MEQFKNRGIVCNHQQMFTFKKVMVSLKVRQHEEFHESRVKHADLITSLKNFDDEDKYAVFKFPSTEEYDHELHSEAALSSLFVIYGEIKENLNHQFVPPELVRYYAKKKEKPKEEHHFTRNYYNEMWQIGMVCFGLMFPELGYPFETNKEYKEWCWDNMATPSSKQVMALKSYNKLYTGELIEIVQKLLIGKTRPDRKRGMFSIFKSNDDFDETPYRLNLDEALKLTATYRKEAKYRFKEWSKEDYFSAYLTWLEMEKQRKQKIDDEKLKKGKDEENAKKKLKANARFEADLLE